jgi:hypothetical protein
MSAAVAMCVRKEKKKGEVGDADPAVALPQIFVKI